MKYKVGVNEFVKRQIKGSGKTYSLMSFDEIANFSEKQLNNNNYNKGYRDGVVLIPVSNNQLKMFHSPLVKIDKNTKLIAEFKKRRIEEEGYISIKALNGKPLTLDSVELVLYRNDVLKETNEESTTCDWELISFHGVPPGYDTLPMGSITMMRNQLQKRGGTKGHYSSKEWAESIDFWQKYALKLEND